MNQNWKFHKVRCSLIEMNTFEVNFDGIVGPTHNYAGLSFGNVASTKHKASTSNPKEAALQGLKKMKFLMSLGMRQGVLPPQERPDLVTLRRLGFTGSDEEVLRETRNQFPELLSGVWSASSMWTANAATVAPSADTVDKKVHFTPANLIAKFHRSLEPETTSRILQAIFSDPQHFVHHSPLPLSDPFGDEGAANHTRFASEYGNPGVHFFVYGRKVFLGQGEQINHPKKFPARQTFEASSSIARMHQLDPRSVIYAQQNPEAIDAGVFHNDVAAVGNLNTLLYHEQAFVNSATVTEQLSSSFRQVSGQELYLIQVPSKEVTLQDAVNSYLFNSQLISPPGMAGAMILIAPRESQENPRVSEYLEKLTQSFTQSDLSKPGQAPIEAVRFFDLRESMRNGGGPACLRLRISLTEEEVTKSNAGVYLTEALYSELVGWVEKHYRDQLHIEDLVDPQLIQESREALDELTQILKIGSVYPFQF